MVTIEDGKLVKLKSNTCIVCGKPCKRDMNIIEYGYMLTKYNHTNSPKMHKKCELKNE
ncbi:hypothetical protein MM5_174 [Morganella phage vB_Mm5]